MRIVYILNSLGVGGTERQVVALGKRMQARGHAIALLILLPARPGDLTTDLQVVHLNLEHLSNFIPAFQRASSFLDSFHADLLHSNNFHGNIFARLLRIVHRKPRLISTIHNVYEGGWARMLAYRLSDPLATRITAVSSAVAERYLRLHAVRRSKCIVLTNGVDAVHFTPDRERRRAVRKQMGVEGDFLWLAIGRDRQAKDFANLIQAFGQAWNTTPTARLWIAGEAPAGESPKTSYAVARTPRGALDCVQRLGVRSDIPALLDAADGFVLSSAWEGMPLALGEAMAMEKPCVATDVGGVRELAGSVASVVAPRNSPALAAAMIAVMQTPSAEREAQGRAARERIRAYFSIEAKADQWDLLYRSICQENL